MKWHIVCLWTFVFGQISSIVLLLSDRFAEQHGGYISLFCFCLAVVGFDNGFDEIFGEIILVAIGI